MIKDIPTLEKMAVQVRRDIIRMVAAANSGHPGGSLDNADLLTALYFNAMQQTPATWRPDGKGHDMFFLSIGHVTPVYYSVLARAGYFDTKELHKLSLAQNGQTNRVKHCPFDAKLAAASGSLGQGLSVACGAALAKRMDNDPHLVYTLIGDGEAEEGQIWEASMFAAARKIDNLIAIVDWNGQQIDGAVKDVLDTGDLHEKWRAFGWETIPMKGNDMADVIRVLALAKAATGKGKPVMIIMKTEMGHGVDFMAGTHEWHGKAPSADLAEKALAQLPETSFGDF